MLGFSFQKGHLTFLNGSLPLSALNGQYICYRTTLYKYINTYLYKILINKNNKISYITMSMPLLYNIEKFNNTVTILSSVSMYTDVYSVLWFSITEGAIRLLSPDLKTRFVRPLTSLWRASVVSVHLFMTLSLAHGQWLPCVYANTHWASQRSKAPVTLVHKFKNTFNENTHSKLHVIM